jgi:hypothetical protein
VVFRVARLKKTVLTRLKSLKGGIIAMAGFTMYTAAVWRALAFPLEPCGDDEEIVLLELKSIGRPKPGRSPPWEARRVEQDGGHRSRGPE